MVYLIILYEGGWAKWRNGRTLVIKITSGTRGACYFRHELLEGRGLDETPRYFKSSASRCGGIFVPSIFLPHGKFTTICNFIRPLIYLLILNIHWLYLLLGLVLVLSDGLGSFC